MVFYDVITVFFSYIYQREQDLLLATLLPYCSLLRILEKHPLSFSHIRVSRLGIRTQPAVGRASSLEVE